MAKNILVEDTLIRSLLGELEELTSQEHMMVSAHGLNLTHQALRNIEELLNRDDRTNERERLERVKAALDPVSASGQVFSSITENRLPGSGSWVEDRLRSWMEGSQPLLWLHGGPGVGKSHLASKIISDLSTESLATPAPVVAFFFYKNNDVDLRSLNKALRTLAWQVATQQSRFAVHAEEFCMKEDPGNNQSFGRNSFSNYFTDIASASPTCLVIDGIDEAETEEQEVLFTLLEKSFIGKADMKAKLFLCELCRNHQRYQSKSRRLVGMGQFVIKSVLHCRSKAQIRKVVKTMPQGISAMLCEELQRLSKDL